MGSGVVKSLWNIATMGASGSNSAQKEAMAAQQEYQQQALLTQQMAYMQQLQNYEDTKAYYEQQNAIQERELANEEQQSELASKYTTTAVKRQTEDRNSSDLTKGNSETSEVVKAELKGEEDEDDLVESWY